MSESVTGTIGALLTRGIRGDLQCHLVFTNQRIIVSVKGLLAQIAAGAGGSFGAVGAVAGAKLSQREESKNQSQVQQMSPDQLLQSNKKNIEVPYSKITRLELGKKLGTSRLYIVTPDETFKFKFQGIKQEELEGQIRPLIPATVQLQTVEKLSD